MCEELLLDVKAAHLQAFGAHSGHVGGALGHYYYLRSLFPNSLHHSQLPAHSGESWDIGFSAVMTTLTTGGLKNTAFSSVIQQHVQKRFKATPTVLPCQGARHLLFSL